MSNAVGSDVSKWQGIIQWDAWRQGQDFALIKATEGSLSPGTPDSASIAEFGLDPQFRRNWAEAKRVGLIRGAYHFARPDLNNAPDWEAAWYLSVIGPLEPGDLLMLDAECGGGNWNAWCREWLAYVHARVGFWPIFYTYRSWPAAHGVTFAGIGSGAGLFLSAPDVSDIPPPVGGWPFTAVWQHVSGKPGGDIFNGTREQLLRYGKPFPTPAPAPVPAPPAPAPEPVPIPPTPAPPPPPAPGPEPHPTPGPPTPDPGGTPVQNPPVPPVEPPPVPEPPIVAEQGVTTSEWKLVLGYLAQGAAIGTADLVNVIAKAVWHTSVAIPADQLQLLVDLEFAGGVAVLGYAISRGVRKLNAK